MNYSGDAFTKFFESWTVLGCHARFHVRNTSERQNGYLALGRYDIIAKRNPLNLPVLDATCGLHEGQRNR